MWVSIGAICLVLPKYISQRESEAIKRNQHIGFFLILKKIPDKEKTAAI